MFLGAFARFFLKSGGFEPLGPKGTGIACRVFSHSCSLSVEGIVSGGVYKGFFRETSTQGTGFSILRLGFLGSQFCESAGKIGETF